jgi:hypothetical protein
LISYVVVVDIDLNSSSFKPGKKGYNRIKWCLQDRLNLKFNFLVTWTPIGKVKDRLNFKFNLNIFSTYEFINKCYQNQTTCYDDDAEKDGRFENLY